MSRGSPEALARGDQPLPICKYVIKSMFVYSSIAPSQKNSCSSPPPPKNILSRVSPEALARHVNPLQYLNKYVSIFFPHPPPPHTQKSCAPHPPPLPPQKKKKTKSTLKNKMSRAGVPLSHRPDDFIPYKNKTLCIQK